MDITPVQLRLIIQEAAELGAMLALSRIGKLKPYLKKSEAFRKYGRSNVERWIASGEIKTRKDGNHSCSWRIDRLELEAIVRSAKLLQYL